MGLLSFITSKVVGVQQPSPTEFREHPDHRQIATFFLGWTFILSLRYILPSLVHSVVHSNSTKASLEEKLSYSRPPRRPSIDLVLVLTLCFSLASIAQFLSFLAFNPNKGDALCAFVVAWAGMAGQSAKILGLLKTSFELRAMGVSLSESIALWAWLAIGLIFIFATNAVNIGTIQSIDGFSNLAFCYRRRFLPISIVASLIYIVTESYLMVRLVTLLAPNFMRWRHRIESVCDIRFGRVMSLFLLDIMTIVPQAIVVNVVADAVPFAIGSSVVLVTFNFPSTVAPSSVWSNSSKSRTENRYAGSDLENSSASRRELPNSSSITNSHESSMQFAHANSTSPLASPSRPADEDARFDRQSNSRVEDQNRSASLPRSDRRSVTSTDSEIAQSVKGAKIGFVFRNSRLQNQYRDRMELPRRFPQSPDSEDGSERSTSAVGAKPEISVVGLPYLQATGVKRKLPMRANEDDDDRVLVIYEQTEPTLKSHWSSHDTSDEENYRVSSPPGSDVVDPALDNTSPETPSKSSSSPKFDDSAVHRGTFGESNFQDAFSSAPVPIA